MAHEVVLIEMASKKFPKERSLLLEEIGVNFNRSVLGLFAGTV